jgi:hypothetical protein
MSPTYSTYAVRLGPLSFTTLTGALTEQLGEKLTAVGSTVVRGEATPRPFPISLPILGDASDTDPYATGLRLRRQLRQLLENPGWQGEAGLPFAWEIDPDLNCWLMVGGGDVTDPDGVGITFGEWKLELTDCYIAGRPGTHRIGRRADIRDRRTGVQDRAFDRIFTTDFAASALATYPSSIPGDVEDMYGVVAQGIPANVAGPSAGTPVRTLYRNVTLIDGDVVTFEPDRNLPSPQHVVLEDPGQLRLWDIGGKVTDTPVPLIPGGSGDTGQTKAGDLTPDTVYGWERVLGDNLRANRALAVDNGVCRLRWAGSSSNRGLWIEAWDAVAGYVPIATVAPEDAVWMTPIEVTPERVVIEYGQQARRIRAILQRGWTGPRLEQVRPGNNAEFTMHLFTGAAAATETPTFVTALKNGATVMLRAAASHTAVTATVLSGSTVRWSTTTAMALQVSCGAWMLTAAEVAGLSLEDCQTVPILVPRR